MDIHFMWGGRSYVVEGRACDLNRIVLPDGTVLAAGAWLETEPPQPKGLHEIPCIFQNVETPEGIAELMNGVVAREA